MGTFLKIFSKVACPMVKPPVGIEVSHFLFSRPLLYAILFSASLKFLKC